MKKILSLMLAFIMIFTMSACAVFAEDETPVVQLTDIAGTPYGTAVNSMVHAGIINGYEDNTFRPENSVTRAEASKLIYKTYVKEESTTDYTQKSSGAFTDLSGYSWAKQYIGWCVAEGIAKGYGDGTFHPGDAVTVNEFLAMLIRAAGQEKADMVWPDDYILSAAEQGLTTNLVGINLPEEDGNIPCSRGNCAIAIFATGLIPEVLPDAPEAEHELLEDFSGRAFGIITGTGKALNPHDDVVDIVLFKIGTDEVTLMAKKGVDLESLNLGPKDGIVCLQMSKGEITNATPVTDYNSVEITSGKKCLMIDDTPLAVTPTTSAGLQLYKVTKSNDYLVSYQFDSTTENYIPLDAPMVVYRLSREAGELSYVAEPYYEQISKDDFVAAFACNPDDPDIASILIYVKASDATSVLTDNADYVKTLN